MGIFSRISKEFKRFQKKASTKFTVGGSKFRVDFWTVLPTVRPDTSGPGGFIRELSSEGLTKTDPGSLIPRVHSRRNRVPGAVIWMSAVTSVTQGNSTEHNSVDCMVVWSVGVIDAVEAIWADDTQIFGPKAGTSFSATSTLLSVLVTGATNRTRFDSTSAGPDLTQLETAINATTTNFSNGGNNTTAQVISKGQNPDGSTWCLLAMTGVTEAAGANATIAQTKSGFAASSYTTGISQLGTESQVATTVHDEDHPDETPGYRNAALTTFRTLRLHPYGNRMPSFSALIRQTTTEDTIDDVIHQICLDSNIANADVDVSTLTQEIRGYTITDVQTGQASLDPLLIFGDLTTREDTGKLRFIVRRAGDTVTVAAAELGATREGDEPETPLFFQDVSEQEIPRMIHLEHIDEASEEFLPIQQTARRNMLDAGSAPTRTFSTHNTTTHIRLPIVMTQVEGQALANKLLQDNIGLRRPVGLQLGPQHMLVQEGDTISATFEGEVYSIEVASLERGANYITEIRGRVDDGA